MTAQEFEACIVGWAKRQTDISALIQIGSRTQGSGHFDALSDWDFHLYSTNPERYHKPDWLSEIAPLWCANVARSRRGVMKISAVFTQGLEADFVLLKSWQMKLLYWGMKYPSKANWMPLHLHRGILETRVILQNSGYRVLVGGQSWETRLDALKFSWPGLQMTSEEFGQHAAAFWQKVVWVAKKIARPELRSAMHWLHKLVVEHVYCLLEEEAWLAGKKARPEALKAEKWLDDFRMKQTDIATSLDQKVLAQVLLSQITLFEEVSRSVAASRGFQLADYSDVAAWLRAELNKIAGPS